MGTYLMNDNHFYVKEFDEKYENPRKIPRVTFIESVPVTLKSKGVSADFLLRQLQELLSKYKLMDAKLRQSRVLLASKIPEITKTIDTVTFLKKRLDEEQSEMKTSFGLTESVFCEATIKPQKIVHLWLGANVLCEYTYDEALEMLTNNINSAKINLSSTLEDLAWVQDQVTILEVNIARVYNHDVITRKNEKELQSK